IALTITAQCFGAGLSALVPGRALLDLTGHDPHALTVLSIFFPWALAVLSGSGSGPILTFAGAFLKDVAELEEAPSLAALACVAGACGRTMSPVAAVVLYCAGLVGEPPLRLVRVALPALLAGVFVAFAVLLCTR